MSEGEKRKMGRPPKDANDLVGKRPNFSFRLRSEVRGRLVEAAKANGRSISEEIEYRCEMPDRIAALEAKIDRLMEIIAPIAERDGPTLLETVEELRAASRRHGVTFPAGWND